MGRNNQQRRAARHRTARRASGSTGAGGSSRSGVDQHPPGEQAQTVDEQVAAVVLDAVDRLRSHSRYGADHAVSRVLHTAQTPVGRRAVTQRLTTLLTDCVAMAWERGWQPADLHRIAGRDLDEGSQLVLGDAMVHQLSRFAEATIAQRWPAQLREIGAQTWWARDTDPVAARTALRGAGPDAVVPAALRVVALLVDLPPLECLDPLPGKARGADGVPGSPQVEERVLSRVRALLAKAESTTFEAEAETFTAGAQALMARHSIDAAMLAAGEGRPTDSPSGRRIGIDRPYEAPKVLLLDAVATANRCRTVWSSGLGFVTVIGFERDLAATETIFTSLLVQATAAMAGEGRRVTRTGHSRTRAFRQSFLTAYAHRIGARLREVTDTETAAAADQVSPSSDGGAAPSQRGVLVRVLAQRAGEVDERVSQLFPRLVTKPLGGSSDPEGWSAGTLAAEVATLVGAGRTLQDRATG